MNTTHYLSVHILESLIRDLFANSEKVVEVAKELLLAIKKGELGKSGCD